VTGRADLDPRFEAYLLQAVELSSSHVAAGGIPFAAVVVDPRHGVVGSGVNRVAVDRDPTAHAEVTAMRAAYAGQGDFSLAGCTLLASGEPCALCYTAALWFNIDRIVFAVDRHGAAAAGFDYRGSYDIFAVQPADWSIDVRHLPVAGGNEPFDRWRARRAGPAGVSL